MNGLNDSQATASRTRRRLYQDIFDAIAGDIVQGTLAPGMVLPTDPVLSARFEVSRTVVREAIQELASVRLLDVRHGAGTFVNHAAQWDLLSPALLDVIGASGATAGLIEDLLDIRRMFEVEAAMLAATRADADDLAGLEALVGARPVEMPLLAEEELLFQTLLVCAAHNRVLSGLHESLRAVLRVILSARARRAPGGPAGRTLLAAIVSGIRERRPDRVQAAMLAHLQDAERALLQR